jgi:hypothetical protein
VLETLDQYKLYCAVNDPTAFACMKELENVIDGPVLHELAIAALRQAKTSIFAY